jgi:hypothetical protein
LKGWLAHEDFECRISKAGDLHGAAFLIFAGALLAEGTYNEPWRPQFHFTPPKNFMNDPNGLVYYKGE